jgi:ubiquinone/menaquinone biosynthesis C-methylase UbiE
MINKIINSILSVVNLRLVKASNFININKGGYIIAKDTIQAAKADRLSVCDYVEKLWNQVGETQKTIDKMKEYGAFKFENPTVCEIGAGTGRYMEKVFSECNPSRYESYETASDWAEWLQKEYQIISQQTDGHSLKHTADDSMDLIHAHGVFVYLKFLDNVRYFNEMIRTIKPNGLIIFDCYTEDCMNDETLERWLSSEHNFPSILPNDFIVEYYKKRNFQLLGNFFNAHGQGKSKYFVFKKLS